jgi:hypothetical protein
MIMYKLMPVDMFGNQNWVMRLSDYAQIRIGGDGPDYQEYLKWVAEGNTPEPAEGAE